MCSPHLLERLEQRLVIGTNVSQEVPTFSSLDVGEREQEVLSRNELVPKVSRISFGLVENLIDLARQSWLGVRLFRIARSLSSDHLTQLGQADAEFLQDGHDDALVLVEQRGQQVEVVDERIARATREINRGVKRFGCFYGEFVWIDHLMFRICRKRRLGVQRRCRIKSAKLAHRTPEKGNALWHFCQSAYALVADYCFRTIIFFTSTFPSTSRRNR